jgi:hypothetical protein
MATSLGMTQLPMDLYVDSDHHVRRISFSMDAPKSTTGQGAMTMTEDFYDFGVPVTVTAPPADQVVDSSGLLGGLATGSGIPG